MIGILTSSRDPAGVNIRNYLLKEHFKEKTGSFEGTPVFSLNEFILAETKSSLLEVDPSLDDHFDVDFWLFGSKHASAENIPALTVHSPGNWNNAKYGGKMNELAFSDACAIKNCLISLNSSSKREKYEVCLEVTHHGPTSLKKPVIFVEIGSSKEYWEDSTAAAIVSEAVLKANERQDWDVCVGFGGTHYAPGFTKLVLNTDYATGHIGPKYVTFSPDNIKEAIEKTKRVKSVVLDWKGLNSEQKSLINTVLSEMSFPVHRLNELI